jgi:hypothetical protein
MKTLRTHGLFRLVRLAPMVVLCVAIGLLGTQQRAEAWSAGPIFDMTDVPPGGAHGKMAENAILWLDSNNLLPAGYLSAQDRQLLREGASTPDGIWGVGPGLKNTWWWEGALQVEALIGRDIVELGTFGYSCTGEPCFTFKDDWENDFDNLMNHEFADLSVWNPIKYWADKAKQDLNNNNRSRAMIHAGYAMHFAQDYLNPAHLGSLYQEVDWPSYLELDWETTDYHYLPKAWSVDYFQLVGRCFTSGDAFPISIENDLLSYRHSNALNWPTPLPSLDWIYDQGQEGVLLDKRITEAIMWSEQASLEILQYVFGLEPPGGCISDTVQKTYIGYYQRAADPGGLIYWAGRLNASGGNLTEIIEAFANSAESQALYGTINSSNISTVVNGIYNALFGRNAEAEGLNYYVNGFNSGQFTAATIMLNVLYGAQNEDLQSVNNKLAATNLFTRTIDPELDGINFQVTYAGEGDAIAGRNFLASVTWDPTTVPTQDETTLYMQIHIADPGDPILNP